MKRVYKIVIGVLLVSILIVAGIIAFKGKNEPVEEIEKDSYNLVLFGDENITLQSKNQFDEPGYYAILNNDIVTENVEVINNIKDEAGNYTVVYKYKDIEKTRNITIEEKKVEVKEGEIKLELIGDSEITVNKGDNYEELNAKAYYNNEDISDLIQIQSNVNVNLKGQYNVKYTIEYSGKSASIERIVKVVENESLDLQFSYDKNYTNKNILLGLIASGSDFLYIKYPDNTVTTNKQDLFEIKANGTYKFIVYDKFNKSVEKEITITNIDKEKPSGSCTFKKENGKTIINVSASDNIKIDHYLYNSKYTSTNNTYTVNGLLSSVSVNVYDIVGNENQINCVDNTISGYTPLVPTNSNIEMHFIVSTSDDDAILIRTDKATIMIDGGQYDKNHKVISYLKKIGVKKIDLLIGSHIQYNHVQEQGPIIDTFPVSKAIYSIDIKNCYSKLCDSKDIKYVLDSINKHNTPVEVKKPGDFMQVGDMKLYFIGPLEPNKRHNKNSFVFILEHNSKKYMFTGDLETDDKKLFDLNKFNSYASSLGITLDVDFFKWPHHGINKVTDAFFKATTPEYALVPNYHGCSNLKRRSGGDSQMKRLGIKYFELCDGKDVVLTSDGKTINMQKVSNPSSYYKN